jgi:hypothetical protein
MRCSISAIITGFCLSAMLIATGSGCGAGIRGDQVPEKEEGVAEDEYQRQERLTERMAEMRQRIAARLQVREGVLAGRITLREAAARFRALQRQSPHAARATEQMETRYPNQSEGERFCREVIEYIRTFLDKTSPTARVLARLEKELEERLRNDGRIRLANGPE